MIQMHVTQILVKMHGIYLVINKYVTKCQNGEEENTYIRRETREGVVGISSVQFAAARLGYMKDGMVAGEGEGRRRSRHKQRTPQKEHNRTTKRNQNSLSKPQRMEVKVRTHAKWNSMGIKQQQKSNVQNNNATRKTNCVWYKYIYSTMKVYKELEKNNAWMFHQTKAQPTKCQNN